MTHLPTLYDEKGRGKGKVEYRREQMGTAQRSYDHLRRQHREAHEMYRAEGLPVNIALMYPTFQ